ncbi:MAG TPA: sodium:proton antiporter [Bacteroidetes bacterium]|nr:sodium:proton antiporter [Bacteroidota bacterium]
MNVAYFLVLPFALLLLLIALAPLFFPNWWSKHYPKVSFSLGTIVLVYYVFYLNSNEIVVHTITEYISFIVLIGALYIVSGGIHISTKDLTNPKENVLLLLVGAILANLLGTTGASMLLIRPWIKMNKARIQPYHIVFFIFIVSNVGGSLTPIGDPPLFLGYLKGIPFWWITSRAFPIWLTAIVLLLLIFYFLDRINFKSQKKSVVKEIERTDVWKVDGLINFLFLGIILLAVFIKSPLFLREGVIIVTAIASYYTTKKTIHTANHFTFHPIQEVAILFAGIFATMIPALELLRVQAQTMTSLTPSFFYWNTGLLSSFLDNAPTYLSFLSVAEGNINITSIPISELLLNPTFSSFIIAISIGAVFFGANTYIGNGPNFMVKSIAEHYKVPTPSFVRYITHFTIPFLLPVLIVIWLLFFN